MAVPPHHHHRTHRRASSAAPTPRASSSAWSATSAPDGIQVGCRGGGCGVCRVEVLAGDVYTAKRMSKAHVTEADLAHGIVLVVPDRSRRAICPSVVRAATARRPPTMTA